MKKEAKKSNSPKNTKKSNTPIDKKKAHKNFHINKHFNN